MDGGSDQLLSRTGLTKDEDCCVRGSDLLRSIEKILETITLPDNLAESMFHFDLLTEVNILGLELVFQCFDFRKSRPKFDRPLLYLPFELVMGFLQRLLYLLARGDVHHHDMAFLPVLRNCGPDVHVEQPRPFLQERHLAHLFRLARKYFF